MSTGGLPQFSSLFEMVSACGLCEMPTDIDVLDSSGPCDSVLGSVLRQLEALVTGSTTTVGAKEGFEPPSNLAAVLAMGWLVAQHGVLETLLLGIISPVTRHTATKVEQQPAAGEADSGSCQLAWSRARLSLRALGSALQQHASLAHQARQWLPRDGQQQRALQAYLRWHHQDEQLLWQALRACHSSGAAAELSRYRAHLQQHHPSGGALPPNQLASLAEGCPGFWP